MRPRAILGIGVDITKTSRIQKLVNRGPYFHQRFLTGTFHPIEVEEYNEKEVEHVKMQYLASRWALKEALVKASGRTDLDYTGIYLKKIRPTNEAKDGTPELNPKRVRPILTVDGDKNTRIIFDELKVCQMHSSISHEEDYAIAFVTLETEL